MATWGAETCRWALCSEIWPREGPKHVGEHYAVKLHKKKLKYICSIFLYSLCVWNKFCVLHMTHFRIHRGHLRKCVKSTRFHGNTGKATWPPLVIYLYMCVCVCVCVRARAYTHANRFNPKQETSINWKRKTLFVFAIMKWNDSCGRGDW